MKIKNIFTNNVFVFLWINLSFLFWFYQNTIQSSQNDILSQTLIENIIKCAIIALSYFPFVNFVFLMIYKLQSSRFIYLISILYIFYFSVFDVLKLSLHAKNIFNISLTLIYSIIWLILIISTIIYMYKKPLK